MGCPVPHSSRRRPEPIVKVCRRFKLQALHTRHHAPAAAHKPRSEPWRKPTRSLIRPSTGSTGHVRKREMAPPLSVWSLSALGTCGRAAAGGGAGGGATDDCQLRWGDTRPVALYGSMSRASMAAMLGALQDPWSKAPAWGGPTALGRASKVGRAAA